jgi:hypothetical protein
VYRATDTRLGREVAIKVAKEQFFQRFEREPPTVAETESSLLEQAETRVLGPTAVQP